jgi:hypothetical protein
MTTYLQTVEIVYPQFSNTVYFGLELKPVCPPEMEYSLQEDFGGNVCLYHERSIETPTGHMKVQGEIWFYPDNSVEAYYYDILHYNLIAKYIWWKKPTLGEAIMYKLTTKGKSSYFRFHSNGAVEARAYGANYYFGPDQKGLPLDYYKEAPSHYCVDDIKCYNEICKTYNIPCEISNICLCDGPYYVPCTHKAHCMGYELNSEYGKQFYADLCTICGCGLEGWLCDTTCAAVRYMENHPSLVEHEHQ